MPSQTISAASSSPAPSPESRKVGAVDADAARSGQTGCADGGLHRPDRRVGGGLPGILDTVVSAAVAERHRRAGYEVSAAQWLSNTAATLRVALMGYAVAIVVSIPLAIALVNSRFLSRTLYPILVIVQSTPIVAVAPIIVVTLGASDLPRVVITFLITFFPIVVSTVTGLMATPEELIELSRSLRAGRAREMLHIRLPFAVPYIFSALKISITLADHRRGGRRVCRCRAGLGFFIMFSTSFFKISQAFAALAMLVALSLVLFRLCTLAQRWFVPWSLPKSAR